MANLLMLINRIQNLMGLSIPKFLAQLIMMHLIILKSEHPTESPPEGAMWDVEI